MRAETPIIPAPNRPKRRYGRAFAKSSSGILETSACYDRYRSSEWPRPPGFTARSTEMMHEINARGK